MMNIKPVPALVIIGLISFVLFVAFAVCQEDEVLTWSWTDEEPPEVVWYYDGTETFRYLLEPEPNEPNLTYTAEELDEIYKDEPALGKLAKSLWGVGEPNEQKSILEIGTGIWTCTVCGKIYHNHKEIIEHPCKPTKPEPNEPKYYHPLDSRAYTCPKCYEGAEGDLCPGHYEPNEPDLTIDIPDIPEHRWKCSCGEGFGDMFEVFCSCGKTYKTFDIIMKCVPTWPDYIELDKDLVILTPGENTPTSYHYPIVIEKGTKIYFKDD